MNIPPTYDAMFRELSAQTGAPFEWLKAFAYMESGLNPENKTGSHWGLFQVSPGVVEDFNKATKNSYTHDDMLDAAKNCRVMAWEFPRIAGAFKARGIPTRWSSADFRKLMAMGWNAGWSKVGGVTKVSLYLKGKGIPVTHDNVFKYAKEAGASWTIQSKKKYDYQRDVEAVTRRLMSGEQNATPGVTLPNALTKGGKWIWILLAIAAALALSQRN